jgi:WD40 repeat protein
MGDEEIETTRSVLTVDDSGIESFVADDFWEDLSSTVPSPSPQGSVARFRSCTSPAHRTSAYNQTGVQKLASHNSSPVTPTAHSVQHQHPNYKLLHLTHTRLRHRFLSGSYRLSTLQSRGSPASHTNTIYCLQLYTYPETGIQVLFTGSKDRTIKEWDLATGAVLRTIGGVHEGSVLSICVYGDYLASAGSDSNVVVWDLVGNKVVKVIDDHEDSVLCVRFDDARLVSCSKGELLMEVLLPQLTSHHKTVPSEPTPSRILTHSTL